jgi:hypothetical protein
MENERVLIAALIFILLVVGSNLLMYGIARGAIKGGDSHWMSALKDALSKPMEGTSSRSMDELRRKVEELEKKGEQ